MAGDWHGDVEHVEYMTRVATEQKVDGVVQLGDFGYTFAWEFVMACRRLTDAANCPLWWIDGNHDDHDAIGRLYAYEGSPADPVALWPEAPRVLYVPRGSTWRIGEDRVMGLGGAVSIDRSARRPHVSWWPGEDLSEADVGRALDAGPVDIMFTHDVPFGTAPIEERLRWAPDERLDRECRSTRQAIAAVVESARPRLLIHGHHHRRYDGVHTSPDGHRTAVIGLDCNGKGEDSWTMVDAA